MSKKFTEATRDDHLAVTGGRKHDEETHHAWGAICYWFIDGKEYQEHQPDIGDCKWFHETSVSDTGDKADG